MDKVINVRVSGSYMTLDSRSAGAQHEANATVLRIEFDQTWEGLAKTVTFWDAKGRNPTKVVLTTTMLEDINQSALVYLAPIPGEAMAESGAINFTVDGYIEGKRQRSFDAWLEVEESHYAPGATDASDPTPTQAEQLQAQIEEIMGDIQAAVASGAAAEAAKVAAEAAATGIEEALAQAEEARDGAEAAETNAGAAKDAAISAKNDAVSAKTAAETAKTAAETAKADAVSAKTAAESAKSVAEDAKADAESAKTAAESARDAAESAASTATSSRNTAVKAADIAVDARDDAVAARNAAEIARDQAQAAAGGGVMTFNGRSGAVTPRSGDYTAEMVGAATPAQVQEASNAASAAQSAADGAVSAVNSHAGNTQNPHGVTLSQIGAAADGHNHAYEVINPVAVELTTGAGAGHGGYIDFHFSGSTEDHTSRIIEEASGALRMDASNGVKVGASNVAGLRLRNISVGTSELTEGAAASGYSEGDIHIVV